MTTESKQRDLAAEVDELRRQLQKLEGSLSAVVPLLERHLAALPVIPWPIPGFWASPATPGSDQSRESPVPPWEHLVARRHPWRRQLYVKGRNMTVRQLVGTVKANGWDQEQAARNLDLPVEAIHEALRYAEENEELLNFETAYEHLLLAQKGHRRGTAPVPR
jgi:uncharacterized protein (DUF433 family)